MNTEKLSVRKNNRNSALELLRIISMFSIVLCHFATHGGFDFSFECVTIPRLWWCFIEMGGNFGVDIFVLISGYFLINSRDTSLNLRKIINFWGQVFFYSVLLFAFSFVIGKGSIRPTHILTTLLPITFSKWWFASTYFMLFLLHPYINILLHRLEKNEYRNFLILLTIFWCIIPTITNVNFQLNQLLEFMYMYSIAGYIKLHGVSNKLKCKHCLAMMCVFLLITYLSGILILFAGTKVPGVSKYYLSFYARNKMPILFSAIFIFIAFIKMKPFYDKAINIIASATFGVYLLHDSPLLRKCLWIDWFKNSSFQDSNLIILYSIGVAALVFVICTFIDLIRKKFIEQLYQKCLNFVIVKISKPAILIYDKIKVFVFGNN